LHRSSLRWFAISLLSVDALLVAAFVASMFGYVVSPVFYQLINLDAEGTLAAWFSSSKLLIAGCIFGGAAYFKRSETVSPWFYMLWAMALVFLSLDEAVGIHERITLTLRNVEYLPRFSGNHGIWIPLYFIIGVAFVATIAKPSLRLLRSGNRGIVILFAGVVVFVFGAVIVEIASYGELRELENRRMYMYQVAVEESFELFGVTTILIGSIKTCFGDLLTGHRIA